MRDLIWIIGTIALSVGHYLVFGQSRIFALIAIVGVARVVLGFIAEHREIKRFRALENLNFEERRQLLEKAGHQGLVKRSPPD